MARPRHSSMVTETVSQLREMIESGKHSAGERLPSETVLGQQLGVSRTVLREAVGRLQAFGMVSVRRGQGMFVGQRDGVPLCAELARSVLALSANSIAELAHFRTAMECYVVRLAATRANRVHIAQLEMILEERLTGHDEVELAMNADFQFHRKLAEIAGSELLLSLLDTLRELLLDVMSKVTYSTIHGGDTKRVQAVHREIIESIRQGDSDKAEAAMRKHMEFFWSLLDELDLVQEKVLTTPEDSSKENGAKAKSAKDN